MPIIKDYQIEFLGVEYADYFQGYGTSFTEFDKAVTGIGDDTSEAYEDALDQIASLCIDTSNMPDFKHSGLPLHEIEYESDESIESEKGLEVYDYPHVWVGIRYSLEKE